ncbi:igLON family member 5-like isoform X1 [Limulus polyphemus]|uniref:IgLON family member 5-like isoform X1 n=2 Tax=Limulus polyphemus TaxID=6850 RepID=A0ABM1S3G4_LIMPO|nr:igLON family member 5-like isoform X1 [Limulus polyphemus]
MYEWTVITFFTALQISRLWTITTTSPLSLHHVSPDLVEVDCRGEETIASGTWIRSRNITMHSDAGFTLYADNATSRRNSCCSLCIPNVMSDSNVCSPGQGKNEGYILQIRLYISIPAKRRHVKKTNRVAICQGGDVHLLCNVNSSSRTSIAWRRTWDNVLFKDESLVISNVQREDEGIYLCEATDENGHVVKSDVMLLVEFPPLIYVPNEEVNITIESECVLQCIVEGLPAPEILWFKDNTVLDERTYPYYNSSIEKTENCTVFATLTIAASLLSGASNNSSIGNYTCEATNKHGRTRAYLQLVEVYGITSNVTIRNTQEENNPKKFNVTGFIVGMLPPLFISFYIILKLGYRSRYAEERAEEQGMREEPFFVSY